MDALESVITDDFAKDVDALSSGSNKSCEVRHSTCDCFYGPDEEAKLDAVLATVHKLIECLNSELDDNQMRDLAGDPVAMATEQLTSLHHVTDLRENWLKEEKANDVFLKVVTGADKHPLERKDETTDKKRLFVAGEKICNKLINEDSCVKAKENNDYFTSADLPLISASKSNKTSGAEANLKRKAYATKRHALDKDKQMTQEKTQFKISQKLIKTLPVLEEVSSDYSDYSVTKTTPQDLEKNVNFTNHTKATNEASSSKNGFEFLDSFSLDKNKFDNPKLHVSDDFVTQQSNGNVTSFSTRTTSEEIFDQIHSQRNKQDRGFESESSSTDQDNDNIVRIKEFLAQRLARKSGSNELEETTDDSSDDDLKDVFNSHSLKTSPGFFEKVFNMTTMAKKTALLAKHKKLFRSFQRSQTYSGKHLSSEKNKAQSKNITTYPALDFGADPRIDDLSPNRERQTHKKSILRSTKSEPSGFDLCSRDFRKEFSDKSMDPNEEDECFEDDGTVMCRVGNELSM